MMKIKPHKKHVHICTLNQMRTELFYMAFSNLIFNCSNVFLFINGSWHFVMTLQCVSGLFSHSLTHSHNVFVLYLVRLSLNLCVCVCKWYIESGARLHTFGDLESNCDGKAKPFQTRGNEAVPLRSGFPLNSMDAVDDVSFTHSLFSSSLSLSLSVSVCMCYIIDKSNYENLLFHNALTLTMPLLMGKSAFVLPWTSSKNISSYIIIQSIQCRNVENFLLLSSFSLFLLLFSVRFF